MPVNDLLGRYELTQILRKFLVSDLYFEVLPMGKRYVINQKNLSQFVCAAGRKDSLFFLEGERGLALRCTVAGGRSWIFQ